MKKSVLCLTALIASAVAFCDNLSTNVYYSRIQELLACTNSKSMNEKFREYKMWPMIDNPKLSQLAKAYDRELAAKGLGVPWFNVTYAQCNMPFCATNDLVYMGIANKAPVQLSVAARYGIRAHAWSMANDENVKFSDLIDILSEMCSTNGTCYDNVDMIKNGLQKKSLKVVKKYLRHNNMSFVMKDGVNPCEPYMTSLNTALNAGYFSGLNEWLSTMGVSNRLDTSKLPTPAEVNRLKESVLEADKDMTPSTSYILMLCLGVDGYNAFVKEYNGEN